MSGYAGFMGSQDSTDDFLANTFLINQLINKIATTALVKVVAVTNAGGVSPVGTVDVSPMVHQVDSDGNPTEHGVIHNVPYFRIQGGTDAIIIDPVVGDIGAALFCSRDISVVKRTKADGNPGSNRKYDWSDALYLGGYLNGIPTNYVRYANNEISVVSPVKVTVTAPNVQVNATTKITMVSPLVEIDGNVTVIGNINATGTMINNAHNVGSTHQHTASGGSGIGGPPV